MPSSTWPAYLELHHSGHLARRAREAVDALTDCACCHGNAMLTGVSQTIRSPIAAPGGGQVRWRRHELLVAAGGGQRPVCKPCA